MGRMMIIRIRSRERHQRQLGSGRPQEVPFLPSQGFLDSTLFGSEVPYRTTEWEC